MITVNKINELYEILLFHGEINTKELSKKGFTSKDIDELISRKIIRRNVKGTFKLNDVDHLYLYGKRLIAEKQFDKATKCFQICNEIDDKHVPTFYQLFIRSIQKKEFSKTFNYLDKIIELGNAIPNDEIYLYLYLLNVLTKLPEKYQTMLQSAQPEDFYIIKYNMDEKTIKHNEVVTEILNHKYKYALTILKEFNHKNNHSPLRDIILKELLFQSSDKLCEDKQVLMRLVIDKKYPEIIKYLEKKQETEELTRLEKYAIDLSNKYLEIESTKVIPIAKKYQSDNTEMTLFDAITYNNYYLALKLSKEYAIKYKFTEANDILYNLLKNICELIDSLIENYDVEEIVEEINPIDDIIYSLEEFNMQQVYEKINKYLTKIGKSEYIKVIIDHIRICKNKQDFGFETPINMLKNISTYDFKFSDYIKDFYLTVAQNDINNAKLYLDILSTLKSTKAEEQLVNNMGRILSTHSKKQVLEEEPVELVQKEPTESEKYIADLYQELKNGRDIILLDNLSSERKNELLKVLGSYLFLNTFVVNNDDEYQLLIEYAPNIEKDIEYSSLYDQAEDAKKRNSNVEYISLLKKLNMYSNHPNSYNYAQIGLTYRNMHEYEKAINYLTIANNLSAINKKYDYTKLIEDLKSIYASEMHQEPETPENEIEEPDSFTYGLPVFDEINTYADYIETDINSICEKLGFSAETRDVALLIYAKNYYLLASPKKGDQFLRAVEQNKNKTPKVRRIITEIKNNRKVYLRQNAPKYPELSLKLYPYKSK